MEILVTGGNGFIASNYVEKMKKEGHECLVYDLPKNDILDTIGLRLSIQKVDLVIHFAAIADLNVSISDPDLNFDVNIRGTYNIAKLCMEYNKDLIFISTCCVYGNTLDNIEREFYTNPMGNEPYATSKIAGEAIIRGMPNLKYCILRIGTVYGLKMRDNLFTGIVFNRLKNNEPVYIDGDGKQTRQLIYMDDLIDGIKRATLKFDKLHGEIINLCGVEKTSAVDTLDIAEKIAGKKAERINRKQRYGQTFEENISIEKAYNLLEWHPKMKFYDGMKYTFENDERWNGTRFNDNNAGDVRTSDSQGIDKSA